MFERAVHYGFSSFCRCGNLMAKEITSVGGVELVQRSFWVQPGGAFKIFRGLFRVTKREMTSAEVVCDCAIFRIEYPRLSPISPSHRDVFRFSRDTRHRRSTRGHFSDVAPRSAGRSARFSPGLRGERERLPPRPYFVSRVFSVTLAACNSRSSSHVLCIRHQRMCS